MLFVTKRDGRKENVQFDKITQRINRLIDPLELRNFGISKEHDFLDPVLVAQKVVASFYSGITTEEIDLESAEICVNLSTKHPSYSNLGGRILVSNLHKKTLKSFTDKMQLLFDTTNTINKDWLDWVKNHSKKIESIIDYNRDYLFDYFGFKTLEKAYLLKSNGKIIERPQDMIMRTAITLQLGNIELIKKTYEYMSLGYYTHASPTLFNSGTNHMQLSSCFLENTEVLTMNGVKKIQDVKIGDTVVTHTGLIKPVLQTHKNLLNNRSIYKLFVDKTKPIFVTGNHKFLATTKNNNYPKWISVEEMFNNPNYYITIPSYNGVKASLNVDNNLAFVFGLFVKYGKFINTENENEYEGISLTIKYDNTINFVLNTIKKHFDGIINITQNTVSYYSSSLAKLFNSYFDNNCSNLTKWNVESIYNFLYGLTNNNFTTNDNVTIEFINYNLANNLYHIFRMFGIVTSIEFNNKKYWNLNVFKNYNSYLKVIKIDKTNFTPTYVYTLGVEDDHSYNVEGLICENCFLLGTNDDLNDIATTWNSCAQISKWAGGIGLHVSNIRAKDSLIKGTNGKSNGLVPFLRVFNDIARWIDQGGKRPGSIAIYLEPHHPDIFEFLDLRKNFGAETERARDLFLALWISDLFMKQVESNGDWYLLSPDDCPGLNDVYGDDFEILYWKYVNDGKFRKKIEARKLWMHILDSQIETGMPYITYKDAANIKSNQKNIGTIKSSNLCVHGDTKILTSSGYYSISSLVNKHVDIWNGYEWSNVQIRKTGTNQNLLRVQLSNGSFLDCTSEHKFYIIDDNNNQHEIMAKDLRIDHKLINYNLPNPIQNSNYDTFKYPYTHGFYCGTNNKSLEIELYNNKRTLSQYIDYVLINNISNENITILRLPKDISPKYTVPINTSINNKLRWFEGLTDADSNENVNYNKVQIINSNEEFLLNVRLMLQTLGVESNVQIYTYKRLLENNKLYELSILSDGLEQLFKLGYKPKTVKFSQSLLENNNNITVISISKSYQNVNTYCFTEPLKHMGMFNGILTGQCNEILEYSDHNEYAVCNLASIALKSFIKPWINNVNDNWVIYTKPNCRYCTYAKNYLNNLKITFTEIPFNNDSLTELKNKVNNQKVTFPQIFINDKLIGGWSNLYQYTAGTFDYDKLYDIAYLATINLNQVIDINYYPVPQTKLSNMKHRPIGLGIQGLADTLVLMRIPFDSDNAVELNEKIMETIYLASMTASNDMSIERCEKMKQLMNHIKVKSIICPDYYTKDFVIKNKLMNILYHSLKPNKYELSRDISLDTIGSYSSFDGSPLSQGKFQFDLWNKKPLYVDKWNDLRNKVIKYGTRNSLLTALMPTASTSQILGNNECFEFFTNNIYTRKTQAGDFVLVNKYLVNDLININNWSTELKDRIIGQNGSIQSFDELPPEFKNLYKTMWEIKQVWVLKNAVARGPFVDQTQSMNIFMAEPDYQRLGSCHFWAWKNGLKTGMYYLRTKPSADAIKFTVDPKFINNKPKNNDNEGCLNCSA